MSNKKDNETASTTLDKIIDNAFNQLKNIIDANTVVGTTIKIIDGIYIVPISKINVGLISGGGEDSKKKKKGVVGAGSSTGFTITPIGFITISNNIINFLGVTTTENASTKIIETILNMSEKMLSKMEGDSDEIQK